MDNTTRRLVDYVLDVRYEDLPATVVAHCKRRVLDTLGCAIAAFDLPVAVAARTLASRSSFDTPATIWGTRQRVAPEMAAFANGVMLRLLDLNDMYRDKSGGHPSDILAALLTAAEIGHSDGKSLIAAIAASYEVYCGCCQGIDLNSMGWDQPVYGGVAAALGSGKLLGLDREQMGHALSLALVPNMALYQTRHGELSNWKGCAGANASRNAIFAALLARSGFTGPAEPVEGAGGLWSVVGRFDWPVRSGSPPALIADTHLKRYPLCYHGQSAVEAALALRPGTALDSIEKIRVETYRTAHTIMANHPSRWAPQTAETADHSLPYVVAVALLDGAVSHDSFDSKHLSDRTLNDLMAKIEVEDNAILTAIYPEASPCRITARLRDGRELTRDVRYPRGHAKSPLDDREIEDKFRELFSVHADQRAGQDFHHGHADRTIALVKDLDKLDDIRQLIESLASGAGARVSGEKRQC